VDRSIFLAAGRQARRYGAHRLPVSFVLLRVGCLALIERRVPSSSLLRRALPFDVWFLVGAVLSGVEFYWILLAGYVLNGFDGRTHYYTAEAIALLHGHFYVRDTFLDGECFHLHGRCYGYFGLTPSLLRLPVALAGPHGITELTELCYFVTGWLTVAVGAWWAGRCSASGIRQHRLGPRS
jgi:hypothetical protein